MHERHDSVHISRNSRTGEYCPTHMHVYIMGCPHFRDYNVQLLMEVQFIPVQKVYYNRMYTFQRCGIARFHFTLHDMLCMFTACL